jgi:hypothetical protein
MARPSVAFGAMVCGVAAAALAGSAFFALNAPVQWYRVEQAKEKATVRALTTLGENLLRARMNGGVYPAALDGTPRDGWGLSFHYASHSWRNGSEVESIYAVISAGSDGVLEDRSKRFLDAIRSGGDWRSVELEYSRTSIPLDSDWSRYSSRDVVFTGGFLQQHPISSTGNGPAIPAAVHARSRRSAIGYGIAAACFFTVFLALTIHDYRRSYAS